MARILIIDDDPDLLDVLALAMRDAGHEPISARDGVEGLARIADSQPALVICDVNMPRLDGFALCRKLRDQGNAVPLIMLTSRDSEVDEALGLELGADDYVPKPFSTRVLLARLAALLRREALRTGAEGAAPALRLGELQLDSERLAVRYREQPIAATVTEFRLLDALARRPGIVQSRDHLLDLARGDETVVADRIIDTYVRRLRRKFEAVDPGFDRIETVIGAGYRWRE